jgi:hypothetical protein
METGIVTTQIGTPVISEKFITLSIEIPVPHRLSDSSALFCRARFCKF